MHRDYEALKGLQEIIPRPEHRVTGEERAWGRRLAKRFGVENGAYDDRTFSVVGEGGVPPLFDHASLKPERLDEGVVAYFDTFDPGRGDTLIAFGWALAEDLAKLA